MTLLLVVLIPFVAAALIPWLCGNGRLWPAIAAGAAATSALFALVPSARLAMAKETVLWRVDWIPDLGLGIALRLDGLGL